MRQTWPVAVVVGVGQGSLWMLYLAGVLLGLAEVFYDTSSQSILPQVVGRSVLPRANSRLYLGELTANNFVGPPLGGFLVAAGAAAPLASAGSGIDLEQLLDEVELTGELPAVREIAERLVPGRLADVQSAALLERAATRALLAAAGVLA